MVPMDISPATVVIGLLLVLLVFLAVRRLKRNGTCDCHKGDAGGGACSGGCGGCSGCGAADKMVADMQHSAKSPH